MGKHRKTSQNGQNRGSSGNPETPEFREDQNPAQKMLAFDHYAAELQKVEDARMAKESSSVGRAYRQTFIRNRGRI